jgi:L-serine dehydratase
MKESWSVFDVIGPVMIGPSSSHTAGACKLGYMAQIIFGGRPQQVILHLHGSFGEVYEGHCTDVAIIGGLLGMRPDDPGIKTAYEAAKKAGMEVEIRPCKLKSEFHPNTVKFELHRDGRCQFIRGASIGGGKISIQEIDKVEVNLSGSYSSLLVCYDNRKFQLDEVIKIAMDMDVPIIKMETHQYKNKSILDIETREHFDRAMIHKLESLDNVHWARFINHISHYN